MDTDISEFVKEGTDLIEVSLGDTVQLPGSCIRFSKSSAIMLGQLKELLVAINKRFKGKTPVYGTPTYKDLVIWCLCSSGYVVSSGFLSSVDDADVAQAWQ